MAHKLRFVRQRKSTECGMACVAMLAGTTLSRGAEKIKKAREKIGIATSGSKTTSDQIRVALRFCRIGLGREVKARNLEKIAQQEGKSDSTRRYWEKRTMALGSVCWEQQQLRDIEPNTGRHPAMGVCVFLGITWSTLTLNRLQSHARRNLMSSILRELGIDRLSLDQRLDLMHEIWESISAEGGQNRMSKAQKKGIGTPSGRGRCFSRRRSALGANQGRSGTADATMMSLTIVFRRQARWEFDEAVNWYEGRQTPPGRTVPCSGPTCSRSNLCESSAERDRL